MVGLLLTSGWGIPIERAKHYLLVMAIDPFKFLQEVRAEAQKVTWPTRKETTVTTMMVFVMVAVASIFFLVADQIMRLGVSFLLGINS
jgi:preprotein translocase subunit SecE